MASVDIPLDFYDHLPVELLQLQAHQIRKVFPNPSLIHIRGQYPEAVFVSLLLHGNELTSFAVLQKLAQFLTTANLSRSLILFVGNVYACEQKQRFLEDQEDFNRIWDGGDSAEHALAQKVLDFLKTQPLFAAIDIHNNTGRNPLYGLVSHLQPEHLYLSSLFSPTLVYFKNPVSAQSVVLSEMCPAITIECGQSMEPHGIEAAYQLVQDALHLQSLSHDPKKLDIHVFETIARIELLDHVEFGFGNGNSAPLRFPDDHDLHNFSPLSSGFVFAEYDHQGLPFRVSDETKASLENQYFENIGGKIKLLQDFYPAMLSQQPEILKQDCVGYIMQRRSI